MRKLQTVTKTNHVVLENHTSHASQLDRPRLQGVASSRCKTLRSRSHLLSDAIGSVIMKASVLVVQQRVPCMPVGGQNGWKPRVPLQRTVKIPGHVVPRQRFKIDLFHRVSGTLDLPVDDCLQGCPGWIGMETGRHLNLASQLGRSKLPLLKLLYLLEGKVEIEMAQLAQPDISRSRWCLRTCPRSAIACQDLQR